MDRFLLTRGAFAAFAVLAATAFPGPAPARAAPGKTTATTYSGRATVVRADVDGLSPVVLSDTGALPSSGGARETSLLTASVEGLLTARVLHAAVVGQNERAHAEASVADLSLTVAGNSIAADFLMARADATCTGGSCTATGSSEIAALVVNGQGITVSGQPNQTIDLGVGKIVLNEQIRADADGTCDITVNALHVVVNGVADVVVSSAHADIKCGRVVCSGNDFVTGGGWITGTPSGVRANFGVAGGLKKTSLWGHLVYIDHGSGMKVKGTGVTDYEVVDDDTRRIAGTCQVDGRNGFTYEVVVADKGEPGRNDTFTIRLSNGYEADGTLDGGNIQLHEACR